MCIGERVAHASGPGIALIQAGNTQDVPERFEHAAKIVMHMAHIILFGVG